MERNFSQRNNLSPLPIQFQKKELSKLLRNQISSIFMDYIQEIKYGINLEHDKESLFRALHVEYFLHPAHVYSPKVTTWKTKISEFLLEASYNEVLDFLEFALIRFGEKYHLMHKKIEQKFIENYSAYRLFEGEFIQISSDEEIESVRNAHANIDKLNLSGAKYHLSKSASFLRKGAWADSIRESIHAVESVACKISNQGSLGKALTHIEKTSPLHPALKEGFSKIYGYTSDANGIRHALIEDGRNPTEQEAIFMFGSCASFTSYLTNFVE